MNEDAANVENSLQDDYLERDVAKYTFLIQRWALAVGVTAAE